MARFSFLVLVLAFGCTNTQQSIRFLQAGEVAISAQPPHAQTLPRQEDVVAKAKAYLPNMIRHSEMIFSGAEPKGIRGFEELAKIGIRTVVSVDSAKPNVALASKHKLRYVHIPIGYGEVKAVQSKMLAAVVRKERGPFYIHCHHGKHRGPAAAAIVAIESGVVNRMGALEILKRCGTSSEYVGLWHSVRAYKRPPQDEPLPELVATATTSSFASAMADIDRQYDNLKLCKDAGWKSPDSHPDIEPSQQALLLKETFRELARSLGKKDSELRGWMIESEALASQLQKRLKGAHSSEASDTLKLIGQQCKRCHSAWRN